MAETARRVSNLTNRQNYNRVWMTGLEPAYGRTWFASNMGKVTGRMCVVFVDEGVGALDPFHEMRDSRLPPDIHPALQATAAQACSRPFTAVATPSCAWQRGMSWSNQSRA